MYLTSTPGFVDETALILYVYLPNDEDGGEESCLTVSFAFELKTAAADFSSTTSTPIAHEHSVSPN